VQKVFPYDLKLIATKSLHPLQTDGQTATRTNSTTVTCKYGWLKTSQYAATPYTELFGHA